MAGSRVTLLCEQHKQSGQGGYHWWDNNNPGKQVDQVNRGGKMKTAFRVLGIFAVFLFAFAAGESAAQSYPSRTIRFVVGYPPGGANDTLARVIAQKLSE